MQLDLTQMLAKIEAGYWHLDDVDWEQPGQELIREDQYAQLRDEPAAEVDRAREQALREITLSFGEHVARAQLTWAQESLATLAALDAPDAQGAPHARR